MRRSAADGVSEAFERTGACGFAARAERYALTEIRSVPLLCLCAQPPLRLSAISTRPPCVRVSSSSHQLQLVLAWSPGGVVRRCCSSVLRAVRGGRRGCGHSAASPSDDGEPRKQRRARERATGEHFGQRRGLKQSLGRESASTAACQAAGDRRPSNASCTISTRLRSWLIDRYRDRSDRILLPRN